MEHRYFAAIIPVHLQAYTIALALNIRQTETIAILTDISDPT